MTSCPPSSISTERPDRGISSILTIIVTLRACPPDFELDVTWQARLAVLVSDDSRPRRQRTAAIPSSRINHVITYTLKIQHAASCTYYSR